MEAWLIYSRVDAKKNQWYIDSYITEAATRDIHMQLMIAEELRIGVDSFGWFIKQKDELLQKPEFAVVRTIEPMLNQQLEYLKIPIFNSAKVSAICNDKAKTYQYVAQLGIPMVESIFGKNQVFCEMMKTNPYPKAVVKAVGGHGGSQVFQIDQGQEKDCAKIYEQLQGQDFVLQPLTGTRHQDLRVYVLGDEIIAAVIRTAKAGFKSNFSLGGQVESYELTVEEKKTVESIVSLFEFGLVGIDFIIGDHGELIFNEIEDVVGARMLYQCKPEIDLVGRYLDFILGRLKNSFGGRK